MSDHSEYKSDSQYSDYAYNFSALPTSDLNPLPGQHNYVLPAHTIEPIEGRQVGGQTEAFNNDHVIYNSYAGVDIVAAIVVPNEGPVTLGELQTISYSIHRENAPVRLLGHVSPAGFLKGARTIAGSMIFTVFNNYAFYRLKQYQFAIRHQLYPVADMLPPVDIVLTFANEYGTFSKMKLHGVTFVDEGGTMSVDDLVTEQTFNYMARGIQPMTGYFYPQELDGRIANG